MGRRRRRRKGGEKCVENEEGEKDGTQENMIISVLRERVQTCQVTRLTWVWPTFRFLNLLTR